LVVAEPFRGYKVAPISAQDLDDLTFARISVECLCLRESISNGDIAWESRLVAIQHRLERVQQLTEDGSALSEDWAELHGELHATLAERSNNRWLLRFRRLLFEQSERYRRISALTKHGHRDVMKEHAEIIQAAIRRDADAACALLETHITHTFETVKIAFGWWQDEEGQPRRRHPSLGRVDKRLQPQARGGDVKRPGFSGGGFI